MKCYNLMWEIHEIKQMSKDVFLSGVKKAIRKVTFEELIKDCKSKTKTKKLMNNGLSMQNYLKMLYLNQCQMVFKCRGETLEIKSHRTYQFQDQVCRLCNAEEETLQHIVNCGRELGSAVDQKEVNDVIVKANDELKLLSLVNRLDWFLTKVEQGDILKNV